LLWRRMQSRQRDGIREALLLIRAHIDDLLERVTREPTRRAARNGLTTGGN